MQILGMPTLHAVLSRTLLLCINPQNTYIYLLLSTGLLGSRLYHSHLQIAEAPFMHTNMYETYDLSATAYLSTLGSISSRFAEVDGYRSLVQWSFLVSALA